MIELDQHPFFVASQFHPEFKSRPERPAPLFRDFIAAALERAEGAEGGAATGAAGSEAGAGTGGGEADIHVRDDRDAASRADRPQRSRS